jgi:allantoicase
MVLGQTYSCLVEVLHYTPLVKLTQPLLGKDMGDGWETRRTRGAGHKDWVIIKLYVNNMLSDTHLT